MLAEWGGTLPTARGMTQGGAAFCRKRGPRGTRVRCCSAFSIFEPNFSGPRAWSSPLKVGHSAFGSGPHALLEVLRLPQAILLLELMIQGGANAIRQIRAHRCASRKQAQ